MGFLVHFDDSSDHRRLSPIQPKRSLSSSHSRMDNHDSRICDRWNRCLHPQKNGWSAKGKKASRFGVGTTTIVTSGIYAIVRHPQYLCWLFFNAAVIRVAQDWIVAIIGLASMLTIYMQARQDDQSLLEQFGDDYKRYMQRVPRMNILLGDY